MNYTEIDPIINEWAAKHKLHLYTQYQDVEVRAVQINDVQGRPYKIGIELQPKLAKIIVRACAWDFKKRNKEYHAKKDSLSEVLEEVTSLVQGWIKEDTKKVSVPVFPQFGAIA